MISSKTNEKILALLTAIDEAGLVELVSGNHAYQTLVTIANTGTYLPGEEDDEHTEHTASIFVQPHLWGWMTDRSRQGEWQDFCITWYESLLNKEKTR